LVLAVAAFGQEGLEVPAEEATPDSAAVEMVADSAAVEAAAMDEMLGTEDAVEEAPMEEDAGDALEAMLAEEGTMETEVTSGSALIGYTAGAMLGYPVWMSGGMGRATAAPVFGIIAATPFGFAVGPIEIGVGAEIGLYNFNGDNENTSYNGLVLLGTLNAALLETPYGPISAEVGGGYYGASLGFTAGATYSFAIPNIPLVVKPYVRANVSLDSGEDVGTADDNNAVSWINAGIYLSYDISTLF
ncbi:hypothetical protein HQ531_13870, partial [bacterium]|nr:hypothetical protein [bacterium]